MFFKRKYYPFLLLLLILGSCSQYSTSPTSRAWHNFNAKYNAYLQAKDNLNQAEIALLKQHKDNYSEMLPILIPLDSTAANAMSKELDATIKKASLIAERHQNSKWIGDSYNLIGKARLYKGDFINAIETFKYVNGEATTDNQKHEALVLLMRAYLESGDESTALRVAEVLKTLSLNKKNERDFYLTKAQIHQNNKEYRIAVAILDEAEHLLKKGEQAARVHFAAGQMYEKLGNTQMASQHYRAVQKNNPSYDLAFYAELNKMMFAPGSSLKQTFAKLSNDRKNIDLLDKLYYSMALIEEKNGNLKEAVNFLNKATKAASKGNQNVAMAYLKLADINYFRLQDYEKSKVYYDSALAILPNGSTEFAKIADRKRALDEYTVQVTTIRTEDSLQNMAKMSAEDLDIYLNKNLKRQIEKDKKDIETAKKVSKAANSIQMTSIGGNPANAWYMYNETLLMQGRIEFGQKWGQRKLEDNWRRKIKESPSFEPTVVTIAAVSDSTLANNDSDEESDEVKIANLKKEILAKLPKDVKALEESKKKQEEAYFALGKIYKTYLLEPSNSIKSFEKLLSLFPQTDHAAEANYYLYLLTEGDSKQDEYKNRLSTTYANTYFGRKILKGTDTLNKGEENDAQRAYANAYNQYENNNVAEAQALVNDAVKKYPGSLVEDKFAFLNILLAAKSKNLEIYKLALDDFLKSHNKSELISLAKEMKTTLDVSSGVQIIDNK